MPTLRSLPRLARALALVLAALGAALAAASPAAAATPTIGVGEHSATVFADPLWQDLAVRDVRLVVGWNVLRSRQERRDLDVYMAAARAADANLLVSFGRSRRAAGRRPPAHDGRVRPRVPGLPRPLPVGHASS